MTNCHEVLDTDDFSAKFLKYVSQIRFFCFEYSVESTRNIKICVLYFKYQLSCIHNKRRKLSFKGGA